MSGRMTRDKLRRTTARWRDGRRGASHSAGDARALKRYQKEARILCRSTSRRTPLAVTECGNYRLWAMQFVSGQRSTADRTPAENTAERRPPKGRATSGARAEAPPGTATARVRSRRRSLDQHATSAFCGRTKGYDNIVGAAGRIMTTLFTLLRAIESCGCGTRNARGGTVPLNRYAAKTTMKAGHVPADTLLCEVPLPLADAAYNGCKMQRTLSDYRPMKVYLRCRIDYYIRRAGRRVDCREVA